MNLFSVVEGILPAVEPGILPGGMGVRFAEGTSISHLGCGRQDAALYDSQDGRRYGRDLTYDAFDELGLLCPCWLL